MLYQCGSCGEQMTEVKRECPKCHQALENVTYPGSVLDCLLDSLKVGPLVLLTLFTFGAAVYITVNWQYGPALVVSLLIVIYVSFLVGVLKRRFWK